MATLGAVMLGAILTLLWVRAGAGHLAPATGISMLLAANGLLAL